MNKRTYVVGSLILIAAAILVYWAFITNNNQISQDGGPCIESAEKFVNLIWLGKRTQAYDLLSGSMKKTLSFKDFDDSVIAVPNKEKYLGLLRQIVYSSGFNVKNSRAKQAYVEVFIDNIRFEARPQKQENQSAVVKILMTENKVTHLSKEKALELKEAFSKLDSFAESNDDPEAIKVRMKRIFLSMPITKSKFLTLKMTNEKGVWLVDTKF